MRVIRFRAWDNIEKTIHYIEPFSSFMGVSSTNGKKNRHDKHSLMTWDGQCFENGVHQDYILMQYTGLNDKNKKELYEGDIVEVTNKGYLNGTRIILWDETLLCYVLVYPQAYEDWNTTDSGYNYLKVSTGVKCKLLGNIYETSELIKVELSKK